MVLTYFTSVKNRFSLYVNQTGSPFHLEIKKYSAYPGETNPYKDKLTKETTPYRER